jgi:hypothetical protein
MVLSVQDVQVVSNGARLRANTTADSILDNCRDGHRAAPLQRTGGLFDVAGLEDRFWVSVLRDVDHGPAENLGGGDVLGKEPP